MATIISLIFGFIEIILGGRFLFRLFGANPAAPVVDWFYHLSTPFLAPFSGLTRTSTDVVVYSSGVSVGSVFEWLTLLALLFYGLIGVALMRAMGGRSSV
jgi:hypothetical protein